MSTISLLDRLLEQASTTEPKEHVLEQCSYAVANVQDQLLSKFEVLVNEITSELGTPEFNAGLDGHDSSGNPLVTWVIGSKQTLDTGQKVLRLTFWKRETGVSYLLLRTKLDSKDRPTYYDLVIGGKRRIKTVLHSTQLKSACSKEPGFMDWVKRLWTKE